MSGELDDVLRKLESAVAEWTAELGDSRPAPDSVEVSADPAAESFDLETRADLAAGAVFALGRISASLDAIRVALDAHRTTSEARAAQITEALAQMSAGGDDEHAAQVAATLAEIREKLAEDRSAPITEALAELRATGGGEDSALVVEGLAEMRREMAALRQELDQVRAATQSIAEQTPPEPSQPVDIAPLVARLEEALVARDEARAEADSLRAHVRAGRTPTPAPERHAEPAPEAQPELLDQDYAPIAAEEPPSAAPFDVRDEEGKPRRMGEVLVEAGMLTDGQLEDALRSQEGEPHERLGAILIDKGYVEENVVAELVAMQLGVPYVHLEREAVDPEAVTLIGRRLASRHTCLPIRMTEDRVVVAMANPLDLVAIEDVELAANRSVEPLVASRSAIAAAIDRYY